MPNVEEDLVDGFRVSLVSGKFQLVRTFFCTDLEGANALEKLLQPYVLTAGGATHTGGDIPEEMDEVTSRGITFYCKQVDVVPDPPADATVTCVYDTEGAPVAGFGPVVQEAGSTLELAETKFDAANRALPFAQREPISVFPPPALTGEAVQYPTVPYFASKPTRIYTRQESSDPMERSKQFTAKINSLPWKGNAAHTVLCVEIFGRNSGDGIWSTRYIFAFDPDGKFRQISFWKDENGNVPQFSTSSNEGVTESFVQGEENFNLLLL